MFKALSMTEYWNVSKILESCLERQEKNAVKYILSGGTAELSEGAVRRTKTFRILYTIINVGVFFLN